MHYMRTILAALLIWTLAGVAAGQCLAPANATSHYLDENTTLCRATYMNVFLRLDADGITLDCNGSILDKNYSSSSAAVEVQNSVDETTVKNCVIQNYGKGYGFSGTYHDTNHVINNTFINISYHSNPAGIMGTTITHNFVIANNTFLGNDNCITIYSGDNVTIRGNNFSENLFNIIDEKGDCSHLTIKDNYFEGNSRWSNNMIDLGGQDLFHARIIDNVFVSNNGSAVYIGSTNASNKTNITVARNIVQNSTQGYAFFFSRVNESMVRDNIVDGCQSACYYASLGENTSFINNTAYNCKYRCFDISSAPNHNFIDNSGVNCSSGIYVNTGSHNAIIQNNTITNHTLYGIYIRAGSANVSGNNVTQGLGWGIRLHSDAAGSMLHANHFCYNAQDNIFAKDIDNRADNVTGDENTCDVADTYNDTGTMGCTYPCASTTTSTSTTSTTSSSTSTSSTTSTSSSTPSTSSTTSSTPSSTTSLCLPPDCHSFYEGWNLIALALTP